MVRELLEGPRLTPLGLYLLVHESIHDASEAESVAEFPAINDLVIFF